jgi:hydroxymethylpyrimidine/phosphomethylpyrimidine kinase
MNLPRVLTIAGSDSSGAAGAQADLKTFTARGVFGMSALTLVTAQNSTGIQALEVLPPALIAAQIDSILSDSGVDALKTGMLLKPEIIRLVAQKIDQYGIRSVVVDPVMVTGDGRRLLDAEGDRAYIEALFPKALIITPNLDEAQLLTGHRVRTISEMYIAAELLHNMGARYVLLKGGHAEDEDVIDLLYDGKSFEEFRGKRLPQWNARGTGCTFASTIAAELAKGSPMNEAVTAAKDYVTRALAAAEGLNVGAGRGAVWHGVG